MGLAQPDADTITRPEHPRKQGPFLEGILGGDVSHLCVRFLARIMTAPGYPYRKHRRRALSHRWPRHHQ